MSVKPLSKVGMVFVPKGKEKSYKLNKVKQNLNIDSKGKEEKNLNVKELFDELIYKIDNMNVSTNNGNLNVYGENNLGAVEVDIKRNFSNYKADKTKIVVDDVKKGKVNNKLDKLRALRKR